MKSRNLKNSVTNAVFQNENAENVLPTYSETIVGDNFIIGFDKENKKIVTHNSQTLKVISTEEEIYDIEIRKYEFGYFDCWICNNDTLYFLKNGDIEKIPIPKKHLNTNICFLRHEVYYMNKQLLIAQSYENHFECDDYVFTLYEFDILTSKLEKIFEFEGPTSIYSWANTHIESGFVAYIAGCQEKYCELFHTTSRKVYFIPVPKLLYNVEMIEYQEDKAIIKDIGNEKYYICTSYDKCFVYEYEEYDEVIKFLTENNTKSIDFITKINSLAVDKSTIELINGGYCIKNTEKGSYIYDFSAKQRYIMPNSFIYTESSLELFASRNNRTICIFKNISIDKYYLFINKVFVYEFAPEELDKVCFDIRENIRGKGGCAVVPVGDKLCVWNLNEVTEPLVVDSSSFKKIE